MRSVRIAAPIRSKNRASAHVGGGDANVNVESKAAVRYDVFSTLQKQRINRNDQLDLGRADKQGHQARPPYGYIYPPRRPGERVNFVPDPEAARIVARLFEA